VTVTTVENPASAPAAHASGHRHLIVTIFGLYAREQGGALTVAELIRLLGLLGVEEAGVRSSISRLKRRGVLESVRVGSAAGYRLAPNLEDVFRAGDVRILNPHRAAAGDPWVLASFSVPERERHLRHRIRGILTRLGCGQVSPGLWIAPSTITEELRGSIERADLGDYVEFFEATHLTAEHARETIGRWWDLDALDALYRDFVARFEPMAERWRRSGGDDAAAFRDYVALLTEWRRLPYLDPGLPLEYLPRGWSGVAAERLFSGLRDLLDASARRCALGPPAS
jgi:phenylacetic acid degradation operon negative regulatory protein